MQPCANCAAEPEFQWNMPANFQRTVCQNRVFNVISTVNVDFASLSTSITLWIYADKPLAKIKHLSNMFGKLLFTYFPNMTTCQLDSTCASHWAIGPNVTPIIGHEWAEHVL